MKYLKTAAHYVIGLAGMGEVGALVANGTVSANVGIPIITGIVTALVGIGAVQAAAMSAAKG